MEWKLLLPSYNDNNKTKQYNIPTVKFKITNVLKFN